MTKRFVSVVVEFDINGNKKPLTIKFNNKTFEVDRVVSVKPCASLKVGGIGERYTIKVLGKETFLFYEEGKWFVEAKE